MLENHSNTRKLWNCTSAIYQSVRRQCIKKYCGNWRRGAWWIPYKILWKKSNFLILLGFWIIIEFLICFLVYEIFPSFLIFSKFFNHFRVSQWFSRIWMNFEYLNEFRVFEWVSCFCMIFENLSDFKGFKWISNF